MEYEPDADDEEDHSSDVEMAEWFASEMRPDMLQ